MTYKLQVIFWKTNYSSWYYISAWENFVNYIDTNIDKRNLSRWDYIKIINKKLEEYNASGAFNVMTATTYDIDNNNVPITFNNKEDAVEFLLKWSN